MTDPKKIARIICGVLGVVCILLALSVLYPFSLSETHAVSDDNPYFTNVDDADEYFETAEILIDGEPELVHEATAANDGERHQIVDSEYTSIEIYQSSPDADIYSRYVYTDDFETAERQIEHIEDDEDEEINDIQRSDDEVVFYTVEDSDDDLKDSIAGAASLYVTQLHITSYELVDTDGDIGIYEPQDGWYDRQTPHRMMGSSGEVHVDTETGEVQQADVEWTLVTDTETYAEYALNSWVADEEMNQQVQYEFDEEDVSEIEEPDWVEQD